MRLRDVESCFLSPLCIAMVLFTTVLHTPPSRAFLAGVHSCAGWRRMQYSAPRFRGFLCSMHKNTRKKLRNFVQYFIKLWFFGFQPQYVVDFDPFYPTKSPKSCGFTQFAIWVDTCYHILASKKQRTATPTALYRLRCAAHRVACTLPSKCRPVKASRKEALYASIALPRSNSPHGIHKSRVAYEGHIEQRGTGVP